MVRWHREQVGGFRQARARFRRGRRRHVLGLALLLTLVVGGCFGGEDEPSTSAPTESVSESLSGSASPGAGESTVLPGVELVPPEPEAMSRGDEAGAEAFVRHYFALVNYAQATGDLEPLRAVSGKRCSGCQAGIDWLQKADRKGWVLAGDGYTTRSETARATTSPGRFRVTFVLEATGQKVLTRSGEVIEKYAAGSSDALLVARWSGEDGWRVQFWETL